MFCTQCGQVNADDARFCQRCGSPFAATTNRLAEPQVIFAPRIGAEQQVPPPAQPNAPSPPAAAHTHTPPEGAPSAESYTSTGEPYGYQPAPAVVPPPPGYSGGYERPGYPAQPPYFGEPQTDGKAIASLVCGLAFFFAPLTQIAAIVLGHLSRSDIRKSGGRKKGEGMALAGLILGYAQLALVPLVLIIAAIALPNLLHSKMVANETSAVSNLRRIIDAEAALYTQSGTYSCDPQQFSDEAVRRLLDGNPHRGYRYRLNYCTKDGYQVEAPPSAFNSSGRKTYCSDQSGVIRQIAGDFASSECLQNGTVLE
jgi:Domain of unknown function (DUF4190)/zinc-ribbon domain